MMETAYENLAKQERKPRFSTPRLIDSVDATAEIVRHFRENYPVLLDGDQSQRAKQQRFVYRARESMARAGIADLPPAAVLRETLDGIRSTPRPFTRAGFTAIGPKAARVWWDADLLEQPDDVLASLDRPRPVLRFYDITGLGADGGRWHGFFDCDVDLAERGRTIEFWSSDRSYFVDLGYVHADGRFSRLARANAADLPRDSRGPDVDGQTVRSNLRPREPRAAMEIVPDAAAREWADSRPDWPRRDIEAELTLHMLYRAFLLEGPCALRRAPRLRMREEDVLRREYAKRERERLRRKFPTALDKKDASAFLVAVLDPVRKPDTARVTHYPAAPLAAPAALPDAGLSGQAWFGQLITLCRSGRRPYFDTRNVSPDLVRPLTDPAAFEAGRPAFPVFEAAKNLRERLSETAPGDVPEREKADRPRHFGGILAKAGARKLLAAK